MSNDTTSAPRRSARASFQRSIAGFGLRVRRVSRRFARRPSRLVFLGYLSYIVLGCLALCLPFALKRPVGVLDNLFTATSAVSTTGLATVSVSGSYTFFGQFVIMTLIQLGGIGYMTLGSFLALARRTDLSPTRIAISRTVFSLPASFNLHEFIKSVIWFTVAIETVGAIVLYFTFRAAGVDDALWNAVFHSVSAFCTAGFGLRDDSFMAFRDNVPLNLTIAALSYLGAIGFIVCLDFWRLASGKTRQVTLTTKIILWATFWLTVIGTGLLFINEPSVQKLAPGNRMMAAFFQCMTAMTTVGFNTVDIAGLSKASLLLLVTLMIIGSSPSGTGGGVKVTTLTAMLGAMWSAVRGDNEPRLLGRNIPVERVVMAFAGLGFYLIAFVIGAYLLELSETSSFEKNLFEVASALGTVGLSMGITATLSVMGKIIIIALMFCGRVGPLTFGNAIFGHMLADRGDDKMSDNDLAI